MESRTFLVAREQFTAMLYTTRACYADKNAINISEISAASRSRKIEAIGVSLAATAMTGSNPPVRSQKLNPSPASSGCAENSSAFEAWHYEDILAAETARQTKVPGTRRVVSKGASGIVG